MITDHLHHRLKRMEDNLKFLQKGKPNTYTEEEYKEVIDALNISIQTLKQKITDYANNN